MGAKVTILNTDCQCEKLSFLKFLKDNFYIFLEMVFLLELNWNMTDSVVLALGGGEILMKVISLIVLEGYLKFSMQMEQLLYMLSRICLVTWYVFLYFNFLKLIIVCIKFIIIG